MKTKTNIYFLFSKIQGFLNHSKNIFMFPQSIEKKLSWYYSIIRNELSYLSKIKSIDKKNSNFIKANNIFLFETLSDHPWKIFQQQRHARSVVNYSVIIKVCFHKEKCCISYSRNGYEVEYSAFRAKKSQTAEAIGNHR